MKVVTIGQDGVSEADILVHDEKNRMLGTMLAGLEPPKFPVALGVIYADPSPTYERSVLAQNEAAQARNKGKPPSINELLRQGHTWEVK